MKHEPDFSSVDEIGRHSDRHFGSERFSERLRFLRLDHAWSLAVGAHVRGVARPSSCTAGSLIVDVRDAKWKKELDRLKPEILARLSPLLKPSQVRDIAFRVRKSAGDDLAPASARLAAFAAAASAPPAPSALSVNAPRNRTLRPGMTDLPKETASADRSELSSSLHDVTDHALKERLASVMVRYLARTAS